MLFCSGLFLLQWNQWQMNKHSLDFFFFFFLSEKLENGRAEYYNKLSKLLKLTNLLRKCLKCESKILKDTFSFCFEEKKIP